MKKQVGQLYVIFFILYISLILSLSIACNPQQANATIPSNEVFNSSPNGINVHLVQSEGYSNSALQNDETQNKYTNLDESNQEFQVLNSNEITNSLLNENYFYVESEEQKRDLISQGYRILNPTDISHLSLQTINDWWLPAALNPTSILLNTTSPQRDPVIIAFAIIDRHKIEIETKMDYFSSILQEAKDHGYNLMVKTSYFSLPKKDAVQLLITQSLPPVSSQ